MATAQGFIQPLAQANTPSGVNNGNPNTVYNTPQTGAQRPLQGWTIDQPAAANLNIGNTAQGAVNQAQSLIQNNGWVAPQQTNTITMPQLTVPEGWMSQAPGVGLPTTPGDSQPAPSPSPVDTSGWQWVVMNGKVPGMNQNLYNTDPNYKRAWDQAVAEHSNQFKKNYNKDSNAKVIEDRLKALYSQYSSGPSQSPGTGTGTAPSGGGWIGGSGGSGVNQSTQQWVNSIASGGVPVVDMNRGWASTTGGDPAKTSQAISNIVSNFSNMGSNFNASNAMQFLDAITEPFLPGNLYMSELGKVNVQNVMKSVLNQVIPGVGTLAQKIAQSIPDSVGGLLGKIRDWVKEGKFEELANDVYKGTREDSEKKVETGNLDATGPSRGSGGGGGRGGSLGGGVGGGWMFIGGGGNTKTPNVSVGEVQVA